MKLSKFLSFVVFATVFSLLYVYQQSEIIRLAYACQKNQGMYQDLLDKNSALRYNIERNASLTRIGDKVSRGDEFQMPDSYQLVKAYPQGDLLRLSHKSPKPQNIIAQFFSVKRQAEAKTIPSSFSLAVDNR